MYTKFAQYYDCLTKNVDYEKRADYFIEVIRRHYGGEGRLLLDLACGTGSLSYLFAKHGWDVIGTDGSMEMLTRAMRKMSDFQGDKKPLFLCQDMQELDLYGTVNVCVCALDSINHLWTTDAVKRVFQRLSLFIETDGLLIFDANTPYKHTKVLKDATFVYETEEVFCVWQNSMENEKNGIVRIDLDFFENGGDQCYHRSSESFLERAYPTQDLVDIGRAVDFDLIQLYTADTFTPPSDDAQRLVYVMKNKTNHLSFEP